MLGPAFAPMADKRGRKFAMLLGIVIFTAGMAGVALHPSLLTFGLALLLALLGKYLFDPAMQAYLGDRISYERRGTALAVTEMAWGLAFIAGIPLMGYLIAKYGWNAPFPLLMGLGAGMFIVILWMVPHAPHASQPPVTDSRKNFRTVLTNLPALAGISIGLWASSANEMINLSFAIWLQDSFGLKIAALAGASAIIGISEISGEGLVALTTDRLGKPRALMLGLSGNTLAALLLPIVGRTEIGALVGLFLFYITFEYIMVSHIPMMTELVPEARATLLSFNLTGQSVGRLIGGLLAAFVYHQFGFLSVTLLAVLFNIFSLLALADLTQRIVILPRIVGWFRKLESSKV
jgi:predicted MFS family arabinose efflux permease